MDFYCEKFGVIGFLECCNPNKASSYMNNNKDPYVITNSHPISLYEEFAYLPRKIRGKYTGRKMKPLSYDSDL
jgi:hypothetical protein